MPISLDVTVFHYASIVIADRDGVVVAAEEAEAVYRKVREGNASKEGLREAIRAVRIAVELWGWMPPERGVDSSDPSFFSLKFGRI